MLIKLLLLSLLATPSLSKPLTVVIAASPILPNPAILPPSTSGSLASRSHHYTAALSKTHALAYRNVSAGSYLFTIHCPTHAFDPLRIDVAPDGAVAAWRTFRGNAWDNRADPVPAAAAAANVLEVRAQSAKSYYTEKAGFSPLSLLRNPMILIAGVSMLVVFGMPYLMDNMDPEMRAEFEERQKQSPVSNLLAGKQQGANPIANFDAAAWLAGSSSAKPAGDNIS